MICLKAFWIIFVPFLATAAHGVSAAAEGRKDRHELFHVATCPVTLPNLLGNSTCYSKSIDPMTNLDCSNLCASTGSTMLCIKNSIENDFISSMAPNQVGGIWIGYYPSTVQWISGCTSSYTAFDNGQPSISSFAYLDTISELWYGESATTATKYCACQTPALTSSPHQSGTTSNVPLTTAPAVQSTSVTSTVHRLLHHTDPTTAPTPAPSAPTAAPTPAPSAPTAAPTPAPSAPPTPVPAPTSTPTAVVTAAYSCPPGFAHNYNNESCYAVPYNFGMIRTNCVNVCASGGGTLPCVRSEAENAHLMEASGMMPVWLGLITQPPDTTYTWAATQGCSSTFSNFFAGHPIAGDDSVILSPPTGVWVSSLASADAWCLCQAPIMAASAPATVPPTVSPTSTPAAPTSTPTAEATGGSTAGPTGAGGVTTYSCPPGFSYNYNNESCFGYPSVGTLSKTMCADVCANYGGAKLPCIHNEAENTHVMYASGLLPVWLGYTALSTMNFQWASNCSSTFSNFAAGYPQAEHDSVILNPPNAMWISSYPNSAANCFCQIPTLAVTTFPESLAPSALPTAGPTPNPTPAPPECPPGFDFMYNDDFCYVFNVLADVDRPSCENMCPSFDTPSSPASMLCIQDVAQSVHVATHALDDTWLGLHRTTSGAPWTWAAGCNSTYTSFGIPAPVADDLDVYFQPGNTVWQGSPFGQVGSCACQAPTIRPTPSPTTAPTSTPTAGPPPPGSSVNVSASFDPRFSSWAQRYEHPAFASVAAREVVVNSQDEIYVLTYGANGAAHALLLIKYSAAGHLLWEKVFGIPGTDAPYSCLVMDSHEDLYLAGTTGGAIGNSPQVGTQDLFLLKLSPSGDVIWSNQFGGAFKNRVESLVIGPTDEPVMVVGIAASANDITMFPMYLARFTSSGNRTMVPLSGPTFAARATADLSGNTIVALTEQVAPLDYFVRVLYCNASGAVVQNVTLPCPSSAYCTSPSVQTDALGNPYIVSNLFQNGVVVIRVTALDGLGNTRWVHTAPSWWGATAMTAAVDALGDVLVGSYVTGYIGTTPAASNHSAQSTLSNVALVRVNSTSGALVNVIQYETTTAEIIGALRVDSQNRPVIASRSGSAAERSLLLVQGKAFLATPTPAPTFAPTATPTMSPTDLKTNFMITGLYDPSMVVWARLWSSSDFLTITPCDVKVINSLVMLVATVTRSVSPGVVDSQIAVFRFASLNGNFLMVRTYGNADSEETAVALVMVTTSDMYVLGTTTGAIEGAIGGGPFGGRDIVLIRMTTLGTMIWIRQFGGADNDTAHSLTVKSGTSYVLASIPDADPAEPALQLLTVPADVSAAHTSTPLAQAASSAAMTYDQTSHLLYAMTALPSASGLALTTLHKVNATSNSLVWSANLVLDTGVNVQSITTDDANLVYVVANLMTTATFNVWCYSPGGTLLWQYEPEGDSTVARRIAINAFGYVYVGGYTTGHVGTNPSLHNYTNLTNMFLSRLSSTGQLLETVQYERNTSETLGSFTFDNLNRPVFVSANGATADHTKLSLVAGVTTVTVTPTRAPTNTPQPTLAPSSSAPTTPPTANTILDSLYNPEYVQWARRYETAEFQRIVPTAVATTPEGDILVLATAQLPANLGGSEKIGVFKFTAEGDFLWMRSHGTPGSEYTKDIAVNDNGDIFITGRTYGTFPGTVNHGDLDVFVLKLDANGNQQWDKQFGSLMPDHVYGIACNSADRAYMLMGMGDNGAYPALWLQSLSTVNGSVAVSTLVAAAAMSAALTTYEPGSVLIAYTYWDAMASQTVLKVKKINTLTNVVQWERTPASSNSMQVFSIYGDSAGNMYVAVNTNGPLLVVYRLSSTGFLIWSYTASAQGVPYYGGSLAVNSLGTILVTARTAHYIGTAPPHLNVTSSGENIIMLRLDYLGALIDIIQYESAAAETPGGLILGAFDRPIITGRSGEVNGKLLLLMGQTTSSMPPTTAPTAAPTLTPMCPPDFTHQYAGQCYNFNVNAQNVMLWQSCHDTCAAISPAQSTRMLCLENPIQHSYVTGASNLVVWAGLSRIPSGQGPGGFSWADGCNSTYYGAGLESGDILLTNVAVIPSSSTWVVDLPSSLYPCACQADAIPVTHAPSHQPSAPPSTAPSPVPELTSTDVTWAFDESHLDWARTFTSSQFPSYYTTGVAVDSDGNVYTLAYPITANVDAMVLKYTAQGEFLWLKYYGTDGVDNPCDIVVDSSDDVYISMITTGSIPGSILEGASDILIMKLDSDGNMAWQSQVSALGTQQSPFMAIGSSNTLFVLQQTVVAGNLYETELLIFNTFVGGHNSEPFNGQAKAAKLTRSDMGGVVIARTAETSAGSGEYVIHLMKRGPAGGHVWFWQHGFGASCAVNSLAVDSAGFVYVAGTSCAGPAQVTVRKYSDLGTPENTHIVGGSLSADVAMSLAVDAMDQVLLLGSTNGYIGTSASVLGRNSSTYLGSPNMFIARFTGGSAGFAPIDVIQLEVSGSQTPVAMVLDSAGRPIVTGEESSTVDPKILLVAAQSALTKAPTVSPTAVPSATPAPTADPTAPPSPIPVLTSTDITGQYDPAVVAWASDSSVISWARTFASSQYASYITTGLAVDSSGNVYTLAYPNITNAYAMVLKYTAQGEFLWLKYYGTDGVDSPCDIVVDSSDDVYISMITTGSIPGSVLEGESDALFMKLDSDGNVVWQTQISAGGLQESPFLAIRGNSTLYALQQTVVPDSVFEMELLILDAATGLYNNVLYSVQARTSKLIASRTGGVLIARTVESSPGSGSFTLQMIRSGPLNELLWFQQQYFGAFCDVDALVEDAAGFIYVAGTPCIGPGQIIVRKYTSVGGIVGAHYVGGALSTQLVESLAVDAMGQVLLLGTTNGYIGTSTSSLGHDSTYIGNKNLFIARIGGGAHFISPAQVVQLEVNGSQTAVAMVLNSGSRPIVVGQEGPPNAQRILLVATESALTKAPTLSPTAVPSATPAPTILPTAPPSPIPVLTSTDITGSYDPTLVAWAAQFTTSQYSTFSVKATAVDMGDNVYVLASPSAVNRDVALIKYTPQGVFVWVKYYGTEGVDLPGDLKIDASNNVYVSYLTDGAIPFSANAGLNDNVIMKLNSDGDMLWVRQFGTAAYELAPALAVLEETLFALQQTVASSSISISIAAVNSANGDLVLVPINTPCTEVAQLVFDQFGRFVLACLVRRVDPDTNIVAGYERWITKLGVDLVPMWNITVPCDKICTVERIVLDSSSQVFVAGSNASLGLGQPSDINVVKVSPTGVLVNSFGIFATASNEYLAGIQVDVYGRIQIVASTNGFLASAHQTSLYNRTSAYVGSYNDVVFATFSSEGVLLTIRQLERDSACTAYGFVLDSASQPVVAALSGHAIVNRKINVIVGKSVLTVTPTVAPSQVPTIDLTLAPSQAPTFDPTAMPSMMPTCDPTAGPTAAPTAAPTQLPTLEPSTLPTVAPSATPTEHPTVAPSVSPTLDPSASPSMAPSASPSAAPSTSPTTNPSAHPSAAPSVLPTCAPSCSPSTDPSVKPSCAPSTEPTLHPTHVPTSVPTAYPTVPPTMTPSSDPTAMPSAVPSTDPTVQPSVAPTVIPSAHPTVDPTSDPTAAPSLVPTAVPSTDPSVQPSAAPTVVPSTHPTVDPTANPTAAPSLVPTAVPSTDPSAVPTESPSTNPTVTPTVDPSAEPSARPTAHPSANPSADPSAVPTVQPTMDPTVAPTVSPTLGPSAVPSTAPSAHPSADPTAEPSVVPTEMPSTRPTAAPSVDPSATPTKLPTMLPSATPTALPTATPTAAPTEAPTADPTREPTAHPTVTPTAHPSASPTVDPSVSPTRTPTRTPTARPTLTPSTTPTVMPTTGAPTRTGFISLPPTVAPSFSDATLWTNVLDGALIRSTTETSAVADVAYRSSYYELVVNTQSPAQIYGSCASWRSQLFSSLRYAAVSYTPTAISITAQESKESGVIAEKMTCHSQTAVNAILSAMLDGTTSLSVTCDDILWKVASCKITTETSTSFQLTVCADCDDPCSATARCAAASPRANYFSNAPFAVAPCVAQTCIGSTGSVSAARVFSVTYKNPEPAPVLLTSHTVATKTSITLTATLSAPGILYCATYRVNSKTDQVISPPTSTGSILLQNVLASTDATNVSTVQFTNLGAATKYQIYCITESRSGVRMSINDALSQNTNVTTDCCVPMLVKPATRQVREASNLLDFWTITLGAAPSDDLTLYFTAYVHQFGAVLTDSPVSAFFPAIVVVPASTIGLSVTLQASLPALPAGTYQYVLTLDGDSAAQYSVTYDDPTQILTVLGAAAIPSAPVLQSATYSGDGSVLHVAFDTETDRGGQPSAFQCSKLLQFACAASSRCVWSDGGSNAITVHTPRDAHCATLGSALSLVSSASVKARCAAASCDTTNWPPADASVAAAVEITAPLNTDIPSVRISAPSTLGNCDALTLDMGSSSGDGGRGWMNVSASAHADGTADSIALAKLTQFLQNNFTVAPPTVIPAALLSEGVRYNFAVRLCNFLGKCGESSSKVVVQSTALPSVTITGDRLQRTKRNALLVISSKAFVTDCTSGGQRRTGLTYRWSVSQAGVQVLSLDTASRDPSKLRLPAYSLVAGLLYDVSLQVTLTSNQRAATATTQVFVQPGDIKADVAEGNQRTVRVGQSITVDASASYDDDVVGLKGVAAGLVYTWSCAQTAPTFATTCADILTVTIHPQTMSVEVTAADSAAGAQARLTLTVADATGSRRVQQAVSITVQAAESPVVSVVAASSVLSIVSSASGTSFKINPGNVLRLLGTVNMPAAVNGSALWSVDDTSSVTLSTAAQSATESVVSGTTTSAVERSLFLILSPNSLPAGLVLTFSLSVSTPYSYTPAASSITVVVNAPPTPGEFAVTPAIGVGSMDFFTFSASRWTDADLPLTYQFGYITPGSSIIAVLQSSSPAASGKSLLPSGKRSSAFVTTCAAQIFDAFSAAATATFEVTVTKDEEELTAEDTGGKVDQILVDGAGSADGLKQAAALSTALLNAVNCSLAEDCSALNRQECFRTEHTCGPCISKDYIGVEADSNDACILRTVYSSRQRNAISRRLSGDYECASSDNCAPFENCEQGICTKQPQLCQADCSGHGLCTYVDSASQIQVPTCFVGDTGCSPVCVCDAEYEGSGACSATTAKLAAKRAARLHIVESLQSLIALEDPDELTIAGWVSALSQASQAVDELSGDVTEHLLDAIETVLDSAAVAQVDHRIAEGVLQSIDAVLNSASHEVGTLQRRRRLSHTLAVNTADVPGQEEFSALNVSIARAQAALLKYRDIAQSDLSPGQNAIQSTFSHFRSYVQVLSVDGDENTDVSVSLPTSALEELSGAQLGKVSFPLASQSGSNFAVSLTSMSSQLTNIAEDTATRRTYSSHPMTLAVSNAPCPSDISECRLLLTMPLTPDYSADAAAHSPMKSFNTTCKYGDRSVHSYECPDGALLSVQCDSSAGPDFNTVITSYCPLTSYKTVCSSLSDPNADAECTVHSVTATSIVCACPWTASTTSRRLNQRILQDTDGDNSGADSSDGTVSVSYVAMLEAVSESFTDTILSVTSLNAAAAERGWSAIVTIGLLATFVVCALFWSHEADKKVHMEKKKEKKEEAKKKADSSGAAAGSRKSEASSEKRARNYRKSKKMSARKAPHPLAADLMLVDHALPQILSSKSMSHKIVQEMKAHHRWVAIIFVYSEFFPRMLRVASLSTHVIVMLFMQSLTYALTNPDDGTCEGFLTEADCVSLSSPYATGESKCYWTADSEDSVFGSCKFVQPDGQIKVILFIAIFAAVVSTPIAVIVDSVILNILSAPTKVEVRRERNSGASRGSSNISNSGSSDVSRDQQERIAAAEGTDTAADASAGAMTVASPSKRSSTAEAQAVAPMRARPALSRRGSMQQMRNWVANLAGLDAISSEKMKVKIAAHRELKELREGLVKYRATLTVEEQTEFNVIWGLDDEGNFIRPAEGGSGGLFGIVTRALGKLAKNDDVAQSIVTDLEAVHRAITAETQNLELAKLAAIMAAISTMSDQHVDVDVIRWQRKVGRRLLYHFQRDLMPGISGKILEAKGDRDNKRTHGVELWKKVAGWTFIGALNLLMLFYILLFALNQPAPRQTAWARSFAMWLVVEIFLVSTGLVLATHIVLPMCILSDVNKIKKRLLENISRFNSGLHQEGTAGADSDFNAADYMFVSTRLAKLIPNLREAKIIAQFRTPWPKQSYHHVTQVSKIYSKKFTALGRSAYMLIMFTLTNVLSLPLNFQDVLVELFSTIVVGYTVLLHIDLYSIYPALVILPLIVIGFLVHFIISANKSEMQKSLSRLLPLQQGGLVKPNELSKSETPDFTNIDEAEPSEAFEAADIHAEEAAEAIRAAEEELATLHSGAAPGSQSASAAAGIIKYLRKQSHGIASATPRTGQQVSTPSTAAAVAGGANAVPMSEGVAGSRQVRHPSRLDTAVQKVQVLNMLEAAQQAPRSIKEEEEDEEKQSDSLHSSVEPDHSIKNAFNAAALERTFREISVSEKSPSQLSEINLEANLQQYRPPLSAYSDDSDSDFDDFDFQKVAMRYNLATGLPLSNSANGGVTSSAGVGPHKAHPVVTSQPATAKPQQQQPTRMNVRAAGNKGPAVVKPPSPEASDSERDDGDYEDEVNYGSLLPDIPLGYIPGAVASIKSSSSLDLDQQGDLHLPAPGMFTDLPPATVAALLQFSDDDEGSEGGSDSGEFDSDSEYDFNAFVPASASAYFGRTGPTTLPQHASASSLSHSNSDGGSGGDEGSLSEEN